MKIRTLKKTMLWPAANPKEGTALGELFKGIVWQVEKKVAGKKVGNNNQWFQDAQGNFIHSANVELLREGNGLEGARVPPTPPIPNLPKIKLPEFKIDWPGRKLGLDSIWRHSEGKGVKIAVLDTGLFEAHQEIKGASIVARKNFLDQSENTQDTDGHGTFCAGLIIAQGKKILGTAPDASLLIGKVAKSRDFVNEAPLIAGIEWAAEQGAHIISISQIRNKASEKFKQTVKKVVSEKGVVILAASGNDGEVGFDLKRFPAALPECISIGSLNQNGEIDAFSTRSNSVNLFAPGNKMISLGIKSPDDYAIDKGTSMATAFTAGIWALFTAQLIKSGATQAQGLVKDFLISQSSQKTAFKPKPTWLSVPNEFPSLDPKPQFETLIPQHV